MAAATYMLRWASWTMRDNRIDAAAEAVTEIESLLIVQQFCRHAMPGRIFVLGLIFDETDETYSRLWFWTDEDNYPSIYKPAMCWDEVSWPIEEFYAVGRHCTNKLTHRTHVKYIFWLQSLVIRFGAHQQRKCRIGKGMTKGVMCVDVNVKWC